MMYLFTPVKVDMNQTEHMSVETKIQCLGGNTGNLVWFEAVRRSIRYDNMGMFDFPGTEISNMILPMANQINVSDPFLENWVMRWKDYSGRVTMIGLGAQLTAELNTPTKLVSALPSARKYALQELGARTETIGVRGSITAECLERIGIKNYRIIGCPSFYMKQDIIKFDHTNSGVEKYCVSWGSVDYKREQYVREFFRRNVKEGDILLLQAMDDFPKTLYEDAEILERHVKSRYPDMNVSSQEISTYIKERGHMFFDWDTWQDFLQRERFALSTGCRFHGNMMSYLAGIPTLWIVHDSRTFELCEAMALPCIRLEEACEMTHREQFAERCVYGEKFYKTKDRMNLEYKLFLKENGLERI